MKKEAEAKGLIEKALEARRKAYVPYSHFHVGAALETETGEVFLGCNVENASYGAANCAERTAFFKAVSEGHRKFRRIAIVGGFLDSIEDYCMPCGICRQVMAEFGDLHEFQVILAKSSEDYQVYRLEELLPHAFLPSALE
jgi:cytidine deaminase